MWQPGLFKITETPFKQLSSSSRCFGMRIGSTHSCERNSAPEFFPSNQRTWTSLFPSMGIPPETADSASL